MRIKYKLVFLILLPLTILMMYQFYNISHAFDQINFAEKDVFAKSAQEVKHATQLQTLTALMTSQLYETNNAYVNKDENALLNSIQTYRVLQEQRYYHLQELREIVGTDSWPAASMGNGSKQVLDDLGRLIGESDQANEKIIRGMGLAPQVPGEPSPIVDALIHDTSPLNRTITQKLSTFVENRYTEIDQAGKTVSDIEDQGKKTLYLTVVLAFLSGLLVILFVDILLIKPLEALARAIESGKNEILVKANQDYPRADEIGYLIDQVQKHLLAIEDSTKKREKKSRAIRNAKRGKKSESKSH